MALSEKAGSDLLTAVFKERGYEIERNVMVKEGDFHERLDGFDFGAKVGFEYITQEANDDQRFTGEILKKMEELMLSKKMRVFVVDERDEVSEEELKQAANAFLDHVDAQNSVATETKA